MAQNHFFELSSIAGHWDRAAVQVNLLLVQNSIPFAYWFDFSRPKMDFQYYILSFRKRFPDCRHCGDNGRARIWSRFDVWKLRFLENVEKKQGFSTKFISVFWQFQFLTLLISKSRRISDHNFSPNSDKNCVYMKIKSNLIFLLKCVKDREFS